MKIDVLSSNTVKITLNRYDMCDYDIQYENLSQKNPDTRRLLTQVLQTVRTEKNIHFDLSGERLFIEAFPRQDGGCMLYISCLESNRPVKKLPTGTRQPDSIYPPQSSVCEVKGLDILTKLCVSLKAFCRHENAELKSALYTRPNDNDTYRLVLFGSGTGKRLDGILKEYGNIAKDSSLSIAKTAEHFTLVEEQDAIDVISRCLG